MNEQEAPRMVRALTSVVSLEESDNDRAYFLSLSSEERIQALELNRRLIYGEDQVTARLQRVLEIADLK